MYSDCNHGGPSPHYHDHQSCLTAATSPLRYGDPISLCQTPSIRPLQNIVGFIANVDMSIMESRFRWRTMSDWRFKVHLIRTYLQTRQYRRTSHHPRAFDILQTKAVPSIACLMRLVVKAVFSVIKNFSPTEVQTVRRLYSRFVHPYNKKT